MSAETAEPMSPERLAEIAARHAAVPAPPWHWIGDIRSGPILATTHSGWKYVMGFQRLGMQGAQPDFPVAIPPDGCTVLVAAREQIVPRASYDPGTFRGIDNPVARFIEHSAADVAALLDEVERLRGACSTPGFTCLSGEYCDGCQASDAAAAAKDRELQDLRGENERLRGDLDERGRT